MFSGNKLVKDFSFFLKSKKEINENICTFNPVIIKDNLLSKMPVETLRLTWARNVLDKLNVPYFKFIKNTRSPLLISLDQRSRECLLWLYSWFERESGIECQALLSRFRSTFSNLNNCHVFSTLNIIKFTRMLEQVYRKMYLKNSDSLPLDDLDDGKKLHSKAVKLADFKCLPIQYILSLDGMFNTYNEITKRFASTEGLLFRGKKLIRDVYEMLIFNSENYNIFDIQKDIKRVLSGIFFRFMSSEKNINSNLSTSKTLQMYCEQLNNTEEELNQILQEIIVTFDTSSLPVELVNQYTSRMDSFVKTVL